MDYGVPLGSSRVATASDDSVPTPVDTISALLRSSGIDAPTAQLVAGLYSRALAAIPVDFSADASGHVRSYALFGDVQFRLTERLMFTVGFRYDHETNSLGIDQTARFAGAYPDPRAFGSTGSPLSPECYEWGWQKLRPGLWWAVISGGTDFAGAFVGGLITLPVVEGEMQVRCLGAAVEAWSEADASGRGRSLVDEVGELVCVKPMPSMPLRFWNDDSGQRYRDSYFDMYPGVWRHGDWIRITPRGGAIIYGRSDATINRHGIRMGTAELYRAVEAQPEVIDSLVVDLEYLGRESYMPLFVVLREGLTLDEALVKRLKQVIKEALSARHVPNEIFQVSAIPRTLSGKKMELPVKKLLMGAAPDSVFKRDAMANADCVDWFVALAARRAASTPV